MALAIARCMGLTEGTQRAARELYARYVAVSLAGAVPSRLVLVVVAWIAMKLSEDHASPQYTARQLEGLARHDWTVIVVRGGRRPPRPPVARAPGPIL